ncbi:hypothetical protein [Geotalea toluenoxydans]|uniref:hypothetical protein n=1 Tax=Geotalea toluenoxydans TaxID=421624 RepID=UPI0006D1B66F|nr:hypothetical protein [Geotalea toluenoxydans]
MIGTHLRGYAEDIHTARRGLLVRVRVLGLYLRHFWDFPACWFRLVPLLLAPTWAYLLLRQCKQALQGAGK